VREKNKNRKMWKNLALKILMISMDNKINIFFEIKMIDSDRILCDKFFMMMSEKKSAMSRKGDEMATTATKIERTTTANSTKNSSNYSSLLTSTDLIDLMIVETLTGLDAMEQARNWSVICVRASVSGNEALASKADREAEEWTSFAAQMLS
jgi:predicted HTH transcriptional regulator